MHLSPSVPSSLSTMDNRLLDVLRRNYDLVAALADIDHSNPGTPQLRNRCVDHVKDGLKSGEQERVLLRPDPEFLQSPDATPTTPPNLPR